MEHALVNTTLEVVVYQGQLDIICNVVGTLSFTASALCNDADALLLLRMLYSLFTVPFLYLLFTALHVMQTRYCDENSVRPSVCPSVRLSVRLSVTRVYCDKTVERFVQIYIIIIIIMTSYTKYTNEKYVKIKRKI